MTLLLALCAAVAARLSAAQTALAELEGQAGPATQWEPLSPVQAHRFDLPRCRTDAQTMAEDISDPFDLFQWRLLFGYLLSRGDLPQAQHELDASQLSTFDSVTRAMERIRLRGESGEDAGPLADFVDRLLEIHGADGTGEGRTQFRLEITLRPGLVGLLRNDPDWREDGTGHAYFRGRLVKGLASYRLSGSPSLQISLVDETQADVDIDYRGPFEGHFKPYNSDVRAVGPEKTHLLFGEPIDNKERFFRRWPAQTRFAVCLEAGRPRWRTLQGSLKFPASSR